MTVFVDSNALSAIDSYNGLSDAIANWMDRTDLNPRIPDFIRLAEYRLRRVLVMPDMEVQVTFTLSDGVPLPADFDSMLSLQIMGYNAITQVSPGDFANLIPRDGMPMKYAIIANNLAFWPSGDSSCTAILSYRAMLSSLDITGSNWLLTSHPDVYLYGAILEAEGFLANDDRIPNIKALLDEKIDEITRMGQRKRYGGGPLVMKPNVCEGLSRSRGW